jgi:hypothetical protein
MSTIEFFHAQPGRRDGADAALSPSILDHAKPLLRETAGAILVIGFFGTLVVMGLLFKLWHALPAGTLERLWNGA